MMDEESEQKINKDQQHLFLFPALLADWCHPRSHIWKCSQSSVLSNHVEVRAASLRAGFKKRKIRVFKKKKKILFVNFQR